MTRGGRGDELRALLGGREERRAARLTVRRCEGALLLRKTSRDAYLQKNEERARPARRGRRCSRRHSCGRSCRVGRTSRREPSKYLKISLLCRSGTRIALSNEARVGHVCDRVFHRCVCVCVCARGQCRGVLLMCMSSFLRASLARRRQARLDFAVHLDSGKPPRFERIPRRLCVSRSARHAALSARDAAASRARTVRSRVLDADDSSRTREAERHVFAQGTARGVPSGKPLPPPTSPASSLFPHPFLG